MISEGSCAEADVNYSTFTWVLFLSTPFEYLYLTWVLCFLETYDFNFTTFERQISYFSLHYISIKVLEVESSRQFFSDRLSVITLVGVHEVIS